MSKNSFTPEELEQIRALLEEAIRENVPKSQQTQQLIPYSLDMLTQIPTSAINIATNIVGGATSILSALVGSLIDIQNQLTGAGASLMQSLAPSLVNVITKHVPVSEVQKQHIQQQIEQQLAPNNPNPAAQTNQ